ncbi:type II toxin-antitoxin system antitoxin SocA domain-containing protein [Halogeometricum luteum]|uniref:DUF4065 domain-containing protein n=1 Tax=Halogeometricum luteum TaxID=2950537 RepID=A0ABU2G997_9EURY|nr:type II toxin-antitoxin system antitoxin SocA domain-containing protein [Halogeometricum sp. S3BR5-2]MDS0297036.1 DUF4065 domain-containing protein [Halogeometricum sp. S3BR5-2]
MYSEDREAVQGRTRFQKMVFLLQQQLETDSSISTYDFEAYDYGPFSKGLYDDLDDLIDRGLVEETREEFDEDKALYEYELTEKGRDLAKRFEDLKETNQVLNLSEELKDEFNQKNLSEVLDFVYSEYPEYTENSVLR